MLAGEVSLPAHIQQLVGDTCKVAEDNGKITVRLVSEEEKANFDNMKVAVQLFCIGRGGRPDDVAEDEESFSFDIPEKIDALDFITLSRIYRARFQDEPDAVDNAEAFVLHTLQERIHVFEREAEIAKREQAFLKENEEMQAQIKERIHALDKHEAEISKREQAFSKEKEQMQAEILLLRNEREAFAKEIAQHSERDESAKEEFRSKDTEIKALQQELKKEREILKKKREISGELEERKEEIQRLNRELEGKNKQIHRLELDLQRVAIQKDKPQSSLDDSVVSVKKETPKKGGSKREESSSEIHPNVDALVEENSQQGRRIQELEHRLREISVRQKQLEEEKNELLQINEAKDKEIVQIKEKHEEELLRFNAPMESELAELDVRKKDTIEDDERKIALDNREQSIERREQLLREQDIALKQRLEFLTFGEEGLRRKEEEVKAKEAEVGMHRENELSAKAHREEVISIREKELEAQALELREKDTSLEVRELELKRRQKELSENEERLRQKENELGEDKDREGERKRLALEDDKRTEERLDEKERQMERRMQALEQERNEEKARLQEERRRLEQETEAQAEKERRGKEKRKSKKQELLERERRLSEEIEVRAHELMVKEHEQELEKNKLKDERARKLDEMRDLQLEEAHRLLDQMREERDALEHELALKEGAFKEEDDEAKEREKRKEPEKPPKEKDGRPDLRPDERGSPSLKYGPSGEVSDDDSLLFSEETPSAKKRMKLHAHERDALKRREINKKREKLQERMQEQKKIYHDNDPSGGSGREGAMAKAAHLAGLTPEGLAGEILTIYLVNILQLLFQTQFVIQSIQFERARKGGIAYTMNAEGNWPEIYPLGADGMPNYKAKPYNEGEAPAEAVIGNGYVPPPDIYRALAAQWKQYEIDMWGAGNKMAGRDLASDRMAMQRPAPSPTPRGRP